MSEKKETEYKAMLIKYERSLKRKSLKDLAVAMCKLDGILKTKEGQDKKTIIARFVPENKIAKFNTYTAYYTNFGRCTDTYQSYLYRKQDIELFVNLLLQKAKGQGASTYTLNILLADGKNHKKAIERITREANGDLSLKYDSKAERLYLSESGLWRRLHKYLMEYTALLAEAKCYIRAYEEYIEENPVAKDFTPQLFSIIIEELKAQPPLRIEERALKGWLRDIKGVATEEELKEWEKALQSKDTALFYPSYNEIEPEEALLEYITGKNNIYN